VRTFFGQGEGGSSDTDVRTFWEQKTSDFSKFMVCSHGQGGLSQCGHFFGQRVVNFFANFCGHLLWTAPNVYKYTETDLKKKI